MNQEHPLSQEEVMAYADGQLQPDHAERISAHLEFCSECAKSVADVKSLSLKMAAWQVEKAPERLAESVFATLETRPRLRESRWSVFGSWTRGRVLAYGFGGAFAVVLLFVVFEVPSLLRSRQPPISSQRMSGISATPPAESPRYQGQETSTEALQEIRGQSPQQVQLSRSSLESPSGPMVIRTVQINLVAKAFETARERIETIVRESKGYVDHLSVRSNPGSPKNLSAVLRFPADRLDAGLAELRKLGQSKEETQNSSDITGQYVDLVARLNNARNTEQRLLALLRDRTGNLKDVVEAEGEIARVREQIERMEAERKGFDNKVQYATVQVELSEEYHAEVLPGTPGTGTRIHNATVEGYEFASETILGIALSGLTYGPALVVWLVVLSSIGFLVWKLYGVLNSRNSELR